MGQEGARGWVGESGRGVGDSTGEWGKGVGTAGRGVSVIVTHDYTNLRQRNYSDCLVFCTMCPHRLQMPNTL